MLSAREVADILKMHIKTFYSFLKRPGGETFPKSIAFGKKTQRWRKRDIDNWITEQVGETTAEKAE